VKSNGHIAPQCDHYFSHCLSRNPSFLFFGEDIFMPNKISYDIYSSIILDELKTHSRKIRLEAINLNLPKFLFLCGKKPEKFDNRFIIKNFYSKKRPDINCIYTEDLWEFFDSGEIDLLTFEEFLAELSDGIILFIESYGTSCELGAFTIKDSLIKKMLVFDDLQHKLTKSFINDGPIKKIYSIDPQKIIYVDINAIFSGYETYKALEEFIPPSKDCKINKEEKNIRLDSFVIEFLELVYLLGPIQLSDLIFIYKYVKEFNHFEFCVKKIEPKYIANFLSKIGLIKIDDQGYLSIVKGEYRYHDFMFKMDIVQRNKFRTKILSRMYHNKKGIIA
jgi:hypothetical protein